MTLCELRFFCSVRKTRVLCKDKITLGIKQQNTECYFYRFVNCFSAVICVKASLIFKCMTEHLFADFSYSVALDTYL